MFLKTRRRERGKDDEFKCKRAQHEKIVVILFDFLFRKFKVRRKNLQVSHSRFPTISVDKLANSIGVQRNLGKKLNIQKERDKK